MDLSNTIMKGLDNVKSRPNGTVHTLHGRDGSSTVAEIVVGKKTVRLNFKDGVIPAKTPASAKAARDGLNGKSKVWAGGGLVLTEDNVASARALLDAVIAATPEAAPEPATA